jgi:hypothetical protein
MYHDPVADRFSLALARLRDSRVRPERAAAIGPMMSAQALDVARLERRLGGVCAAFAETCPATLMRKAAVVSLVRGVLTIHADDASARFELDRWLRSGGERALVKRSPTTVRKVRLIIAGGEDGRDLSPRRTQRDTEGRQGRDPRVKERSLRRGSAR